MSDWTEDEAWCRFCGALMELVRPGKHQPLCRCYDMDKCKSCELVKYVDEDCIYCKNLRNKK